MVAQCFVNEPWPLAVDYLPSFHQFIQHTVGGQKAKNAMRDCLKNKESLLKRISKDFMIT
jgi:hypothetical protein